ncbi:MAG: trypsin-like peptidase domain-containing protein [Dehalococcoidia bacterium]|nr:trypsin-like peptidase domain-containing protein [Dehalococcoidia bacterium]
MNTYKNKAFTVLAVFAVLMVAAAAYVVVSGQTIVPRIAQAAPALYSQDTVTSIFDAASPAVVEIDVTQSGSGIFGRSVAAAQGSGFLVDTNGNILTNNHVVEGATSVKVILKSGKSVDATVVATDSTDDLAVVKVDASAVAGITPLQFADSGAVKPGQMAIAIGTPYGLSETITVGVISGLNRSLSGSSMTGMLQTDASINPGNSGGPLLDANGLVIGINTAIESAPGANGIGFAVPSNVASRVLPDLIAGKQVTRPWLGISGVALDATLAKSLGLSVDTGVYIITVTPGSPADKAGLKAGGEDSNGNPVAGGDVITAVDGKSVSSVQGMSAYFINNKKAGDMVSLTVLRGGSSSTVSVTLGTWPASTSSVIPANPHPNGQPTPTPSNPWPFGGR